MRSEIEDRRLLSPVNGRRSPGDRSPASSTPVPPAPHPPLGEELEFVESEIDPNVGILKLPMEVSTRKSMAELLRWMVGLRDASAKPEQTLA